MMGESIAQPSVGRPLVSVSGARYVGCAGTMMVGPSISDTSRIAELIDRVPHRNAQLGQSRPSAIIARAQRSVRPHHAVERVFCKNSPKIDWYRREDIGGGINTEEQIGLMHGFNSSGTFRCQVQLVGHSGQVR